MLAFIIFAFIVLAIIIVFSIVMVVILEFTAKFFNDGDDPPNSTGGHPPVTPR